MDRQQFKAIGEKMFKELCAMLPKPKARGIVTLIAAQLIREKSNEIATLADKVYAELRGKHSLHAASMILIAADRAAQLSHTRQADWQRKQRERGNCPLCGEKCDTNPRTGKPYSRCAVCRKIYNSKQAKMMLRRRAEKLGGSPATI